MAYNKKMLGVNLLFKKNFSKDPKAKALVSAFAAFFAGNREEDDENNVKPSKDEEEEDGPTKDQLAFLSMVGSLKEYRL
jgi:hypothetical protein